MNRCLVFIKKKKQFKTRAEMRFEKTFEANNILPLKQFAKNVCEANYKERVL